jgi:lipid kinase YegS
MRIILHGKAAGDAPVRAAVAKLRQEGYQVEVRVTWEAGDTGRLVKEAVEEGVGTIVAGGGDGTLSEVAASVAQASATSSCSVGVLPLGTANDFARSCGVAVADPLAALRLVIDTPPTPVDLGELNSRVFINVATGGLGTRISVETPEEMKRVLGGISYVLTGLRRFGDVKPVTGRFIAPDFEWQGSFYAMAVGNGRQAGNGIPFCPQASVDDGLLDVAIMPEVAREERVGCFETVLGEGLASLEHRLVQARVSWLEIEAPEGLHVNLDGEPTRHSRLRFEAWPGALRFHLPEAARTTGLVT